MLFLYIELPPGVVNFVFGVGPRAGQALITHPDVNVISFTGSTTTGYHIKKATSHLSVKLSLEVRLNTCVKYTIFFNIRWEERMQELFLMMLILQNVFLF